MEAKITVETMFDESMIVQEINGASHGESLVKSVIRLKEEGTRKALAELGYMEPAEAKALRARVAELEAQAVAVPEISFAKIELGFGRVEVGEGTWMDVPALIFGKNGNGVVGKPTEAGSRILGVDECLAVVTFANVESLDVVLGKLMKCRSDRFPDAIPADRVLGDGMLSIHPDALNSISDALREIGDTAHNASTGPEVPDVLWGIREKAYEAYIVATDAEAEIMQTANAHAALSSLRANQGGAAT